MRINIDGMSFKSVSCTKEEAKCINCDLCIGGTRECIREQNARAFNFCKKRTVENKTILFKRT